MTTTIELSDSVYSEVASCAQRQGKSVDAYVVDAICAKLAEERLPQGHGWRSVFGMADKQAVAEVQRIIDEEFSQIDPDSWK